jgi:hypothetical protein
MRLLIGIYLVVGFVFGIGLYGWATVSSIRRHGVRNTFRGAATTYAHELRLNWRVPWAAWTVLIAAPLIAAWAIVTGDWDPLGAIFLALLWLLYFVLLRWHRRAKAHDPDPLPRSRGLGSRERWPTRRP